MEEKTPINIEQPVAKEKPVLWKSAISIAAILVIAYILIRMFINLLIPVMVILLLIANRDLVSMIVKQIYKLYKDETYKGLLATVVAVIGFVPFMIFLLGRSLYHMFIVKKSPIQHKETTKDSLASDLITITVKEKVKSFLDIEEDNDNKQR